MVARVSTRIRWDPKAIRELKVDPNVMREVHLVAEDLARDLIAMTPKDTGAGAASIDIRTPKAQGALNVGWDKEHFYLFFVEYGTKTITAQRFARDVLDRYNYL